MEALYCPIQLTIVEKAKHGETASSFNASIKPVCTITNVGELSYVLHHLVPFNNLPFLDINIFKIGIKPMWEDENNIMGGKYIVKLKRETGQRIFERMLLCFCSGSFKMDLNGLVMSIRPHQFILGIWTKSCPTDDTWPIYVKELKEIFGVDFDFPVEFKRHNDSLKDNFSFRNAAFRN